MALVFGSAHLADDQFLAAFHSGELGTHQFHHADHLRLAWLHLHREPFEVALANVCAGIRSFAEHHAVPHLYHETITVAWVRLIASHRENTFHQFVSGNQHRLNKDLLHHFWSPDLLASEAARTQWVPPDLKQLPAPHTTHT